MNSPLRSSRDHRRRAGDHVTTAIPSATNRGIATFLAENITRYFAGGGAAACWNDSFRKIFHFNRWESVSEIQHYCGELSFVDMYNKYKAKFLSSIISTDYSPACVRIWTWIDK